MPIEIKEMSIKINVREDMTPQRDKTPEDAKEMIVQECVDQISRMLNDKKER